MSKLLFSRERFSLLHFLARMNSDKPGSGAGRGAGTGGSIRDAGGAFGEMEAARENQYFYNKQKEQLKAIRDHLDDEISFHEEQIKHHKEAIDLIKAKAHKIEKDRPD